MTVPMTTKKALVTGSAGFIGRHMVRELESRGWQVYTSDTADDPGLDFLSLVSLGFEFVYDLVVHCAYHVGGRAAIDGVNTNFAKNLQLDAALFEWAVRTRQRRVLYFSSSAAYPASYQERQYISLVQESFPEENLRLTEDLIDLDLTESPDANYGWAKLTGERLAEDARKNGLNVSVVRPFSGYGEDQSLDYPFPSIVRRARSGDLSVWGPRGQTRDWIHVSDVVNGALAVVESETEDPVNLCSGVATEMGDLARMVYGIAQNGKWPPGAGDVATPPAVYDELKPTGVFYRVGDPTRFNKYYTPKVSLEEGVRRALAA